MAHRKFALTVREVGVAGARRLGIWAAAGIALFALSWAGYALVSWARYGRGGSTHAGAQRDPLLDRFFPEYDIHERHQTHVAAPATLTFTAARQMDLSRSPLVRAIFTGRELMMGASPDETARPRAPRADARTGLARARGGAGACDSGRRGDAALGGGRRLSRVTA